jgi:hypothetical protein
MGRFFSNLKQKTIAGSTAPTSAQLRDTGQTIYLEKRNQSDIGELILVQKANILQHQNGKLPHPGLSAVNSVSIPDSGAATTVLAPSDFEVFNVVALTIKNTSGGAAGVQVTLSDGTTSILLGQGSVANGAEFPIITPFIVSDTLGAGSSCTGLMIDSSLQIFVASDAAVTANVAFQTMSVK